MHRALLSSNLQIPSKYSTEKAHIVIIAQTDFVSEKSTISYLNKSKKPGSIVKSFFVSSFHHLQLKMSFNEKMGYFDMKFL